MQEHKEETLHIGIYSMCNSLRIIRLKSKFHSMKKVSYFLHQLNNDKKALLFYLFIIILNVFYFIINDDNFILFGTVYGLEEIIMNQESSNSIIDINPFLFRGVSFLSNAVFFNFLILMFYSVFFKFQKTVKLETFLIYFINSVLLSALFLLIVLINW